PTHNPSEGSWVEFAHQADLNEGVDGAWPRTMAREISFNKPSPKRTAGRKLRVLVLMHPALIPPDDVAQLSDAAQYEIKTERNVCDALSELGHDVLKLGIRHDLAPLREAITDFQPDIAFNLLAEFQDVASRDQGVVSYLELMGI